MAAGKNQNNNIFSANDPLDINELASLNDDISLEFIEQLQNQVAQNASQFAGETTQTNDDAELFEEVETKDMQPEKVAAPSFDSSIDDNFVKKYKAKLNKQSFDSTPKDTDVEQGKLKQEENLANELPSELAKDNVSSAKPVNPTSAPINTDIAELTTGNIIEKPVEQDELDYNESLDFLDGNVNYSKYVIYIEPENKDFIDSLTVKERKNLINRILREQDDIAITKKRLNLIQTIIKHVVLIIVTIAIAVPVVYWTVNEGLEASINNYRRSQTLFKNLYREKGKIRTQNNYY